MIRVVEGQGSKTGSTARVRLLLDIGLWGSKSRIGPSMSSRCKILVLGISKYVIIVADW